MNADLIYQIHRDEAFAAQFEADEYRTFLAMPFSRRGGYPADRIHELFSNAHEEANRRVHVPPLPRAFAKLMRVDSGNPAAVVITDEIIRQILENHFFVADLTGGNAGVLIEVGLALALKPNSRVLLFSQDGSDALHFDLKVTHVNEYCEGTLISKVADAIISAARSYETESGAYITQVSMQLTADAISLLNQYGGLYRNYKDGPHPALFEARVGLDNERFKDVPGRIAFNAAVRELLMRRLMWTDYASGIGKGVDAYGFHATRLGWKVIETMWQNDPKMRMPRNARTGPSHRGPRIAIMARRDLEADRGSDGKAPSADE